jgi:hypothetical protein
VDRELRLKVGVLAERRKARSKWADDYWIPVAVLDGETALETGAVVVADSDFTRYFMGYAEIYCHATETEAYVHNLDSAQPALFVVMRRDEEDVSPLPYIIHAVTFSPYEAQDYQDSAEDIVERVAIPPGIALELIQFVNQHHVEQQFRKRKRTEAEPPDEQFGQEPVFERGRKHRRGAGNG